MVSTTSSHSTSQSIHPKNEDFQAYVETVGSQPEFLTQLRKKAFDRFLHLGYPSPRLEDWRHTDIQPIIQKRFQFPSGDMSQLSLKDLEHMFIEDCHRVVVIDGQLYASLSTLQTLSGSIEILNLSEAINTSPEQLKGFLGAVVPYQDQALVALNTAFMSGGIYLKVHRDHIIEKPVHILYVANRKAEGKIFHHRNLIHLEANSQVTLIEQVRGLSGGPYFSNVVSEIVVDENSVLNHYKLQQEPLHSDQVTTTRIRQAAHSQVSLSQFMVGGHLSRNDITAELSGEGGHCRLNSLSLIDDQQHSDTQTRIEHTAPHCTSRQLVKTILRGKSQGVFNGRVIVKESAEKADADQQNKNLLLSRDALMNANPQLEIYTNDVSCTHGSTTGELEEDALFYLRSRGIDELESRRLLINGFANEILKPVNHDALQAWMKRILNNWLENGQDS